MATVVATTVRPSAPFPLLFAHLARVTFITLVSLPQSSEAEGGRKGGKGTEETHPTPSSPIPLSLDPFAPLAGKEFDLSGGKIKKGMAMAKVQNFAG